MDTQRYELYRDIAKVAQQTVELEAEKFFKLRGFSTYVRNMCGLVALKYVDISIAEVQSALTMKEKLLLIDYYIKPESSDDVLLQICHAVDRQGCN